MKAGTTHRCLACALAAWVCGISTAGASGATGTILLVVVNSASLTAQETARKTLMQGWGYTVTPITATASQATFDAACLSASCAYVCEDITSTDLNTKLLNATIPVINEENALSDDFAFSSSQTTYTGTAINITNTTHYITSTFSSGSLTVWSSSQGLWYPSGTVAAGLTTLAQKVSATNPVLSVVERGDALTSGTAAGRRVNLPWGSGVNINALSTGGSTILQRSIEWCLMPVSHWKLDDGAGSTAVDSSAGHNGAVNASTWSTGKISGGLRLNGSTSYVQIADDTDFHVTNALTVAGWIKGTSAWNTGSTVDIVLRKGDNNPNNWELCIANGKVEFNLDGGDADGSGCDGSTTLSLNVWHHVAGTWDGTTMRVYLDGALNGSKAKAAPIGTDTRVVFLGGRSGTDVTNGWVDDVRFYNRCLTMAEIAALASVSPTVTSWENVAP